MRNINLTAPHISAGRLLSTLLVCLICVGCGTIAPPIYADAVTPIKIEVFSSPSDNASKPFTVEVIGLRSGTNVCVVTNQRHYWENGDRTETAQPHPIRVQIDDEITLFRDDMSIFWNNASISHVYDDKNQLLGSYLTTPMHICFGRYLSQLEMGTHKGVIEITSTSGKMHRYEWAFNIEPLEQIAIQSSLIPTTTHLENNPQPTPDFVRRLSNVAVQVNSFDCPYFVLNEGIPIELDTKPFDSIQFLVDNLTLSIDGNVIPQQEICIRETDYGSLRLYLDTSRLAGGRHLARMNVRTDGLKDNTIYWIFRVELPIK